VPDFWNLLEPSAGAIHLEHVMNSTFSAVAVVAVVALTPALAAPGTAEANDALVTKHAAAHGVPESLVRRVIQIESRGNARAVSKGNYGLMQIRLGTARAMGYRGDAQGLLDADTNMTYAVRYLAGAYRAARGNPAQAIRNYQRGYYYSAKAQGFSPYTLASTTPITQQPSAPDPTMLPQETVRRQAIEQQQQQQTVQQQQAVEQQALAQQRITQREAAEQQRALQRQAALQAKIEQRAAAEQARMARQQERIARQQAAEQQRAAQRQALLQQRIEREKARQQQRIEREQARAQQRAGRQARAQQRAASASAAAAVKRAAPGPSYAWYNPMRYFKHPLHQAHPYQHQR
jgi:hypothetical protein